MECNEQTKLTGKRDRLIDEEQDDSSGGEVFVCEGIKQKRKRIHGHRQQCGALGRWRKGGGWRWKRVRGDES